MVAVDSLSKLELEPATRITRQADPGIITHLESVIWTINPTYWAFDVEFTYMADNDLHLYRLNDRSTGKGAVYRRPV